MSTESKRPVDYPIQPRIVKVATCSLNQHALDFKGNKERILRSIQIAKEKGCTYRLGPELEISGYSCEDHFYELDTIKFSWLSFEYILKGAPADILCDVSMPVLHNGVRYNCRIFFLNSDKDGKKGHKIVLIRPKMWLADDGNYREERWFTPWSKDKQDVLEEYVLSAELRELTGQRTVPFGVGIVEAVDGTIASEVCEELFTPESPNIQWGLEGVDIVSNGSGSHWQMGKRAYRHDLIKQATSRNGGVYMYSNLLGLDGNRLVFDGNSMIYSAGKLLATGEHLSFHEVEVVTATINLDDVLSKRTSIVSRGIQADRRAIKSPRVHIEEYVPGFRLTCPNSMACHETPEMKKQEYEEEDEMGLGISRYLWNYINIVNSGGFFLPLSGGVDSGSTSLFIYYMCHTIMSIVNNDGGKLKAGDPDDERLWKHVNGQLNAFLNIAKRPGYGKYVKKDMNTPAQTKLEPEGLVNIMLNTCNMPTKNNTGPIQKQAADLAEAIGSYHMTVEINEAFTATKNMVGKVTFGYVTTVAQEEPPPTSGPPTGPTTETPSGAPTVTNHSTLRKQGGGGGEMIPMEIPRYATAGGDYMENLAIQNIQARLRMLTAYYMAQILPMYRWNTEYGNKEGAIPGYPSYHTKKEEIVGNDERKYFPAELTEADHIKIYNQIQFTRAFSPALLVLASSNADEALRGFYTKYDASSADLNPIGSFAKKKLRQFMKWFMLGSKFGHMKKKGSTAAAEITEEAIQQSARTLLTREAKEAVEKEIRKAIVDKVRAVINKKITESGAIEEITAKDRKIDTFKLSKLIMIELQKPNYFEEIRNHLEKPETLAAQAKSIEERVKKDMDTLNSNTNLRNRVIEEIRMNESRFEAVNRILNVTASPELTPGSVSGIQDDEVEIELTYGNLYELGLLRKQEILGPYSMFLRLCKEKLGKKDSNGNDIKIEFIDTDKKEKIEILPTPTKLAIIIDRFFRWYGMNRHKMTILTPGIHATGYSPDDNRYDQRPFVYKYSSEGSNDQIKLIYELAREMEGIKKPMEQVKPTVPEGTSQFFQNQHNTRVPERTSQFFKNQRKNTRKASKYARKSLRRNRRS